MQHTILFLAANPSGTDLHALNREAREMQVELQRSSCRNRFKLETRWAAEPLDLLRELRTLKPTVVHFSGHGGQDGLLFEAPNGEARRVSPAAIAETIRAVEAHVKLVVLSACYDDAAAEALLAHVDCVVGMSDAINDNAARSFAIGFYGGLGEHASVEAAYEQGCAAISLEGQHDIARPQIKLRPGVNARQVVLAADPAASTPAVSSAAVAPPTAQATLPAAAPTTIQAPLPTAAPPAAQAPLPTAAPPAMRAGSLTASLHNWVVTSKAKAKAKAKAVGVVLTLAFAGSIIAFMARGRLSTVLRASAAEAKPTTVATKADLNAVAPRPQATHQRDAAEKALAAQQSSLPDSLENSAFEKTLQDVRPKVADCYDGKYHGAIQADVVIRPDGSANVALQPANAKISQCVKLKLEDAKFDVTKNGGTFSRSFQFGAPPCDADALTRQGASYEAARDYRHALNAYKESLACKADPDVNLRATIAACKSKSPKAAAQLYAQLFTSQQIRAVKACKSDEISKQDLVESGQPCDAIRFAGQGMNMSATGELDEAFAYYERAYQCRQERRFARLAYEAACNLSNTAKAAEYYQIISRTLAWSDEEREKTLRICGEKGIKEDDLESEAPRRRLRRPL